MTADLHDDTAVGRTVPETAAYLRVGEEKIRSWIKAGELAAINVGATACGRPRFIVLPESLAAFTRKRSAAKPPRAPRRRRKAAAVDFYPD
jgi:excisionase family DNA binding protein